MFTALSGFLRSRCKSPRLAGYPGISSKTASGIEQLLQTGIFRASSTGGLIMSKAKLILKPRRSMAKEFTKPVKVKSYTVTSHAQNRMVERGVKKTAVANNLTKTPDRISKTKIDSKRRPSYQRSGGHVTTAINPNNNRVTSAWATDDKGKTMAAR